MYANKSLQTIVVVAIFCSFFYFICCYFCLFIFWEFFFVSFRYFCTTIRSTKRRFTSAWWMVTSYSTANRSHQLHVSKTFVIHFTKKHFPSTKICPVHVALTAFNLKYYLLKSVGVSGGRSIDLARQHTFFIHSRCFELFKCF